MPDEVGGGAAHRAGELGGEVNESAMPAPEPSKARRGRQLGLAAIAGLVGAAVGFVGPSLFPGQCFLDDVKIPCEDVFGQGGPGAPSNAQAAPQLQVAPVPSGPVTDSGFPTELIGEVQAHFDSVSRSTVKVEGESGHGTAWVLDSLHVVTNWHVVTPFSDQQRIPLRTYDGDLLYGAVISTDEWDDIAVIRLAEPTNVTPLPLASTPVSVNDPVFFVGHPGSMGDWIIGVGTVRASCGPPTFVCTTLPADPGASGSAMLNLRGEVVALISGCMASSAADNSAPRDGSTVFSTAPKREFGTCGGTNTAVVQQFVTDAIS